MDKLLLVKIKKQFELKFITYFILLLNLDEFIEQYTVYNDSMY